MVSFHRSRVPSEHPHIFNMNVDNMTENMLKGAVSFTVYAWWRYISSWVVVDQMPSIMHADQNIVKISVSDRL